MTDSCDVLVVGSGAGGLATAVTAAHFGCRVTVVEKHHQLGGTSAWSGGWLWIPRNPLAIEAGICEAPDAPLEYLRSEIGNRINDPRIGAFLANGPEMVGFFRDHTAMDWIDGNRMPDFHETPGAATGGRSVCAAPFDGRLLGEWAGKLRGPLPVASVWGMGVAAGQDMARFFNAKSSPRDALYAARRLGRHGLDLLRSGRGAQLVNGNALVARLLRSALDLGVTVLVDTPATGLIVRDGRVVGAQVAGRDIHATRGVVLAAGGFPHDVARIARSFDHVTEDAPHRSAAPRENTGDGLRLGESVGGAIAGDLMDPGAWAPVSVVPDGKGGAHFPHLVDRGKPGFIAVGPDGQRFANEANSYHDFMRGLFRLCPKAPHAWMIADARARSRFGIGAVKPFPFPDAAHLRSGYLVKARTIAELAAKIGVPADALQRTIRRFNTHAAEGKDPDFGRGDSAYNRVLGEPRNRPNPTLGALTKAPFYAVKLVPGSLGTFDGLRTDAQARVLGADEMPIEGLFAVGNDAASIMGGNYPSGGITLGPAMTFGYIAGLVLAGRPVTGIDDQEGSDAVL
ncbi:FAD-dependent oxidoreductase [Pseudoprimorskyibacter insulae]|uniref:3-oxosteroid 1-dehydrogenase n=1 Tax=Pseudoprimorskyibacter insulae TaxID=1695997 RepID=A0A2R8AXZ8_9RHOB|nr:FAD-dependent oxidoreductase [Pseudoprimorskyibacter insulae]SPF80915.1 3-oxosteroid 1-dehydrogenase [Pseudoprimorskyibacter insulae]